MDSLDKRQTFLALMEKGWVSLCLDARAEGVELPGHLRGEPRLVLQYGLNMPVPITDLKVGEDGVRATLSFDRTPHCTFVPWSAVYIIMPADADQPGVLYAEDVPEELRAKLGRPLQQQGRGDERKQVGARRRTRAAGSAPEAGAAQGAEPRARGAKGTARRGGKARPQLGLVPPEADPPVTEGGPDSAPEAEGGRKPRARRPALRLVK